MFFNNGFSSRGFSFLIDWFHNFNCCLLLIVLLFVFLVFVFLIFSPSFFKVEGAEYKIGEFYCSVVPVFVLLLQMLPSLGLLYFFGLLGFFSDLTLKIVGHQWYWSYSFSDFSNLEFDSYMKANERFLEGDLRLLDVDNRCVLPVDCSIFFCITSGDVIHSWTLFNIFLKLDAMRGILSTFFFSFPVVGVFYGQCSEICGANHSFMPVVVEVTLFNFFKVWSYLF